MSGQMQSQQMQSQQMQSTCRGKTVIPCPEVHGMGVDIDIRDDFIIR